MATVGSVNEPVHPVSQPVAVGMLLLSELVPADRLSELLRAADLSASLSSGESGKPVVEIDVDGISVFVTALDHALPGDDVLNNIHPVLTDDDESKTIAEHAAHLVVVATQFGAADSAARRAVHRAHATALRALSRLEEAVGYSLDGTTMGPAALRRLFSDDSVPPVLLWAPIWVWSGDTGVTAYTYGLEQFDHPELQVVDGAAEPAETYFHLETLAAAIIDGSVLAPGEALSLAGVPDVQVDDARWVVDPTRPALQLGF